MSWGGLAPLAKIEVVISGDRVRTELLRGLTADRSSTVGTWELACP